MRKVKRGYADIELWRVIGRLSEDLDMTKQETSSVVADFLKSDENFKKCVGLDKHRGRKFDFRF